MAVLVTGGAGYIGSHTVKELQRKNYDVVVYDNLCKGHKEAVSGCDLVQGDIFDQDKLTETIKKYNIDSVIHFAAFSLVGESMTEPYKYYYNNVAGTLSLLGALVKNNVKRIVFSSTAAVYGEPEEVPITEECAKNPTNVYGRTKLVIENMMSDFDRAYGLNYIALRYFNAAGADRSGEIGEDHDPESHLIPIIMQVLTGKRDQLKIFGDDYDTEDGTCVRDYIHVTDLAQAHILALEYLKSEKKSNRFNLGNGNGFSVKQVVDTVEKVTGKKVNAEIAARRSGDPATLIAGSSKAKSVLGWKPEYDSLEKIVSSAWKWHSNHPNGFKK